MDILAKLDVVFAKASFGCDWDGVIPNEIGNEEGRVQVQKFVHPILALGKKDVVNNDDAAVSTVVPVDLILPGKNDDGGSYQTLMISGPNGGGKTLALKSFGLVAMMVKLGIPITISKSLDDGRSSSSPDVIVDFFEDVLVEVGDSQSISKQESTLMARLNALSNLIEKMSSASQSTSFSSGEEEQVHHNHQPKVSLVLLDELGGGTDPVAGSALAQSIMEKLMSINNGTTCKLVATTHSPQLKALSIDDERFECASVLMSSSSNDNDDDEEKKKNPHLPTEIWNHGRIICARSGEEMPAIVAGGCDRQSRRAHGWRGR